MTKRNNFSENSVNSDSKQGFFSPTIQDWRVPKYQTDQFSYMSLAKTSGPAIVLGSALLSFGTYLPAILSVSIPPVGLLLMTIAGAMLLAYGMHQGLKYAMTPTLPKGFEEDVEAVPPRIQPCWENLCSMHL